jgi:hypothetical protein
MGAHFSRWRAMTLSMRDAIINLQSLKEIKEYTRKRSVMCKDVRGELVEIWWGRGCSENSSVISSE